MRLTIRAALVAASLCLAIPAAAQDAPKPSPETMQAARELILTMRLADQFKALFPILMQGLKPAIVQNRPTVEKDFDQLMPVMVEVASARSGELVDAMALIYAQAMSADELRQIATFYKSPVGQKIIDLTPALTQRGMIAGQAWGRSLSEALRGRIVQELRKRGHDI